MFSLFGLFYCAAELTGSIITLVGLGFFPKTVYFGILVVVDILALIYCYFFLRDPDPIAEEELLRLKISDD